MEEPPEKLTGCYYLLYVLFYIAAGVRDSFGGTGLFSVLYALAVLVHCYYNSPVA